MTRAPIQNIDPVCIECGKLAQLKTGADVWPGRQDLTSVPVYLCVCGAYVGTHKGTDVPLGYPAGPKTRAARKAAHAEFDALWEAKMKTKRLTKGQARGMAYKWLAGELGLEPAACHIAHFDAAQAQRVADLCGPIAARLRQALRRQN